MPVKPLPSDTFTTFTVCLLYPRHLIHSKRLVHGYTTVVHAPGPRTAELEAQRRAASDNPGCTPESFIPLMTLEGEHDPL